jgi:hypothetical protein
VFNSLSPPNDSLLNTRGGQLNNLREPHFRSKLRHGSCNNKIKYFPPSFDGFLCFFTNYNRLIPVSYVPPFLRKPFKTPFKVSLVCVWTTFLQTLLRWKSNKYYIPRIKGCVFVALGTPHAPHCHLRPVRLYGIFPHYLINGTIFVKTLLNTKCVLGFCPQLLSGTFLFLRRNRRLLVFM